MILKISRLYLLRLVVGDTVKKPQIVYVIYIIALARATGAFLGRGEAPTLEHGQGEALTMLWTMCQSKNMIEPL